MAAAITFPDVQVISESFAPVNGFVNGCGQAAILMMNHLVTGQKVDANTLLNLIKFSVATGHATGSGSHIGSTNPQDLQWLAEQSGVRTTLGNGASWRSTVDNALSTGHPVVVGLGNAKALGGADANVSGHYVTVVGSLGDGRYIVADPNQPQAKSGGTVVYSAQQIQNARPFATLTPTSAVQTMASTATSGSANGCVHSITLPGLPGSQPTTICLDAGVDGLARFALIATGVVFIIVAILIFTRKEWGPIAGDAAKVGGAAALA